MTDTDRVTRTCDACGQEDDHPHHVMYATVRFEDPITGEEITLDRSVSRHLDCCQCDHCAIVLKHAGDARGLDLADHIQSGHEPTQAELREAGYDVG